MRRLIVRQRQLGEAFKGIRRRRESGRPPDGNPAPGLHYGAEPPGLPFADGRGDFAQEERGAPRVGQELQSLDPVEEGEGVGPGDGRPYRPAGQ